jgi:SAM-dependent methyltransferase
MPAVRSAEEIRDVNTRYHDVAASSYDSKWGIDFGEIGQAQVLGKLRKALGSQLDRGFERSLEIGAGTGYFSLNMLQAGVVREATCTDISPGMVRTLGVNAARLNLSVKTARADAESLPFGNQSFDLVLGHAVPHHLPDLDRASSSGCSAPAAGSRSLGNRRASETGSHLFPSEAPSCSRQCGAPRCAPRLQARGASLPPRSSMTIRSNAWWISTRSSPGR